VVDLLSMFLARRAVLSAVALCLVGALMIVAPSLATHYNG
jgi:hypothetical protein